jgi:HEAT repeat protein
LRIFKETLLRGASDQSRVDSAIELLHRGDKYAWEILLQALVSEDNAPARRAVCRGLIKSKAWGDIERSKQDFLEPLLGILVDYEGEDAKLAAEALNIFEYSEIGARLRQLVGSEGLDRRVRLNVIEALKLWSDKEAISELIGLVDDSDEEVAAAAEKALQETFGIPEDTNKEDLKSIVRDLQRKRPIEIIRDLMTVQRERLAAQREQMRRLEAQRDQWQKLYLAALDREYQGLADDVVRGKMLVEKLSGEFSAVKLWALGKISGYAGDTPEGLREKLIALVSDNDAKVRLETARILSKMSALDPAAKLLEQLKVEQDGEAAPAIFEALGEACFFAFSPGSPVTVSVEVRDQTLEFAGRYVVDTDSSRANKGAEVIRKLLVLGGVEESAASGYLELVASRYSQAKSNDAVLAGELLNVMARLCAPGSGSRDLAVSLFGEFFNESLAAADNTSLREAAVRGLINVDKTKALKLLKEGKFADDNSAVIRKLLIDLAGQIGSPGEIEWLAGKLKVNGNGGSAWQAILAILTRQDSALVAEWADKLAQTEPGSDRVRELLELAEKKAEAQKDDVFLSAIRMKLVELYGQRNDYVRVIEYSSKLLSGQFGPGVKEKVELTLLTAYMKTADFTKAGELISARLTAKKDLSSDDASVGRIESYLTSEEVGVEAKKALLDVLVATRQQGLDCPKWAEQVKLWQKNFTLQKEQQEEVQKPVEANTPAEKPKADATQN